MTLVKVLNNFDFSNLTLKTKNNTAFLSCNFALVAAAVFAAAFSFHIISFEYAEAVT